VSFGLAALVVVGLAVGAVLAVRSAVRDEARLLAVTGIRVSSALQPGVHLFGDELRAQVDVVVDRTKVDPASVRVVSRFAPYSVVRGARPTRAEAGRAVSLSYRFRLLCLHRACAPPEDGAARQFRFPSFVRYRLWRGSGGSVPLEWAPVEVASRLTPADRARPAFSLPEQPLPPVSYRVDPDLLAAGLYAVAGLLALLGVLVLARQLRPLLASASRREASSLARLGPLERALALLRRAIAGGAAHEQRTALDRLARELHHRGRGDLARTARQLAWSEGAPDEHQIGTLVREVELTTGGRA
jgi:hypothetical protein